MPSRPSVSGQTFFTVDPRRSALIVIDMQNAFVAEGGPLETPGARSMIPRLEGLIRFAREGGIPIVWTQSDHRPPYGGLMLRKFPVIGDGLLWRKRIQLRDVPGHASAARRKARIRDRQT